MLYKHTLISFKQREIANKILNQFKSHPDAWTLVDKIIDGSTDPNTKFYALSILDDAVNVIIHILSKECPLKSLNMLLNSNVHYIFNN